MTPQLLIVAGVNGSGKSSLTFRHPGLLAQLRVLDPDVVAKTINPANFAGSALEAGREVLVECQRLLDLRSSFAVETTLSGHTYLRVMAQARALGFLVVLIYVGLNSPELSMARVNTRVMLGGHNIPEDDIRRRYSRSLENLPKALELADHALLFDNSTQVGYQLVAVKEDAQVLWLAPKPDWAAQLS